MCKSRCSSRTDGPGLARESSEDEGTGVRETACSGVGGRDRNGGRRTEVEDTHDHPHNPADDASEAKARPPSILKGQEGGVLGMLLEKEEEARHR